MRGMSTAIRRKLGLSDYLKFPMDGRRHELLDGEEIVTPPPTVNHQRIVLNVFRVIENRTLGRGEVLISPVGVVLAKHTALEPDILYISKRRASIAKSDLVRGAPDLAVEVVSPSTQTLDRGRKREAYEAAGVREYWVVDPFARVVEIHVFGRRRRARVYAAADAFRSPLLKSFLAPVADLFKGLR
jgi:Uma2 family endonuclease